MRAESEFACDDMTLAAGCGAIDYAGATISGRLSGSDAMARLYRRQRNGPQVLA